MTDQEPAVVFPLSINIHCCLVFLHFANCVAYLYTVNANLMIIYLKDVSAGAYFFF